MLFLAKLFDTASLQATKKPKPKPLKSSTKKALSIDKVSKVVPATKHTILAVGLFLNKVRTTLAKQDQLSDQ